MRLAFASELHDPSRQAMRAVGGQAERKTANLISKSPFEAFRSLFRE